MDGDALALFALFIGEVLLSEGLVGFIEGLGPSYVDDRIGS